MPDFGEIEDPKPPEEPVAKPSLVVAGEADALAKVEPTYLALATSTGKRPVLADLAVALGDRDEGSVAMAAHIAGLPIEIATEPGCCPECFGNGIVRRRSGEKGLEWVPSEPKAGAGVALCPRGCKPPWHPLWTPPGAPPVSPPAVEPVEEKPVEEKPIEEPVEGGEVGPLAGPR